MTTNSEYTELIDIEEFNNFTDENRFNAILTIQLGELIENKVFDWENDNLRWYSAAYNDEQYNRICKYFIERFYYREISIEPFEEWAKILKRKIIYELMPKYRELYKRFDEKINPLSKENEYYKNRTIESAYPETLLSENSDYITDGKDEENQRIKEGDFIDTTMKYAKHFKYIDELFLDDLESMFVSMYSLNINGL